MAERLGATFSIDTTNLKAGLAQANRMIRESESEFRAAAAGMGDWTTRADGLQKRIESLNKIHDLQKQKVAALQKEYEKLVDEGLDPASKKATDYRIRINKEKEALEKSGKEIDKQKDALKELEEGTDKASKSTDKLAESTEKTGKGLSALKNVGKVAAAAIAAVAAAAVAGAAKLLSLADETRELRNEMARLETGFTTAGLTAEDATKTYNDLYSVLGDTGRASEAAGHLALLANNSEDLSKWTEICTGIYAQFGDSLPIEGLTEAANETAKTGSLTGVLADALNWAGVNEDDFQKKLDACTNEQERQALITDTLAGLYDEQAEAFRENNKEVIAANEAANNLAQAQADLGAAMEPLNTEITNLKTSILEGLSPALNQIADDLINVFNGVEGAPEKLANSVSSMLSNIIEQLIEMLPQVADFATQLVFMMSQVIVENLPSIVEAAIQMVRTFLDTLADMAPSLIMTVTDAVIEMAETLVDNVDMIVDSGIRLMQGLADGLIEAIPRLVSKIPTIINNLVTTLMNNLPKILDAGVKIILALADGLIQAIPDLLAQLPTIILNIVKGLLTEGIPALIDAGGQLLAGLFKGMLNPSVIWENIKKIGSSILDSVKSFFGINSPSRLFEEEIGTYLGQGMAIGLGEGFEDRIKGVNRQIVKSIDTGIGGGTEANTGLASRQAGRSVVINQYNTYSQAHSRYELFKAKEATAAAVRLAMGGAS